MKRNYIPFIAGMSTMLLLVGLVGASLAGETRPPAVPQSGTLNGQVAYGEAGVALFGKEQVPAGAAWTTEDGAQIPTVLTYTDENGEDHYFISAETAAEVLDMVYGAVYREDLNCIDFGTEAAVDAEGNPRLDGNGQPIYWTGAEFFSRRTTQNEDGTERIVAIGDQKAEIQVGDGTSVIVGHGLEEDSPIREELIQRQMETPTVPEYGVSCGVFTEVDPAVLDPAAYLGRFVDGVALQGADLTYTFHFMPELLQVPMIKWSIDPRDWEKLNTAQVKAAVLENAAPNQIILLHDIYDTSVDAALEIVDTLQGEGYRFVTVQELLEANGIQPEAGVLYCSGDISKNAGCAGTPGAFSAKSALQDQQDQRQDQEDGPNPFGGAGQLGVQSLGLVAGQEGVGHTADGTGEAGALAGLEEHDDNDCQTAEKLQDRDDER